MNPMNHGTVIGRPTRDPQVLKNSDGSHKILLTVAAQNNYKGADGKRGAQFIQLQAFIKKDKGLGAFEYIKKGTMAAFPYSVISNNYTDKNGNMVYNQILQIDTSGIILMDSKKAQKTIDRVVEEAPIPDETAPENEGLPF